MDNRGSYIGFHAPCLKHRYYPLSHDTQMWSNLQLCAKTALKEWPGEENFGVGIQDPGIKPQVYPFFHQLLKTVLCIRGEFTLKQERSQGYELCLGDGG